MQYTKTLFITLVIFVSTTAAANSADLFTVGVGTSVGVNHTAALHTSASSNFNSEVSLRVKALHFLGMDFSFSPTETVDTSSLVFDGKFRMSALIYVVPMNPVAAYLKVGIGAGNIGDMFSVTADSNSYHAGGGLDVNITDSLVISAEFLLLVPGVASIRNTIETHANDEIARMQDPTRANEPAAETLSVSDFISGDNFRVSVGARWYF